MSKQIPLNTPAVLEALQFWSREFLWVCLTRDKVCRIRTGLDDGRLQPIVVLDGRKGTGTCTQAKSLYHVNLLETLAVFSLQPPTRTSLRSDAQNHFSYLSHMGGTRSHSADRLAPGINELSGA